MRQYQCQCMYDIDVYFPESYITRIIHEYSLEYDSKELIEFFSDGSTGPSNGAIFFDSLMNVMRIDYYDDRTMLIDVRHGCGSMVKCDPNEVVHRLEALSAKDILDYTYGDISSEDIAHILTELRFITDSLRYDLVLKCHKPQPIYGPKTWADCVRSVDV